jgi:hypothetical protein
MEEKIKVNNPTLHRYLFTVTTFSKLLAMALFVILPFLGFYLGYKYHQQLTASTPVITEVNKTIIPNPTSNPSNSNITNKPSAMHTPTPIDTSNWKTFKNSKFSINYPPTWYVNNYSDTFETNTVEISNVKNSPSAITGIDYINMRIRVGYIAGNMPTTWPYTVGDTRKNGSINHIYFPSARYNGIRGRDINDFGETDEVYIQSPYENGYAHLRLLSLKYSNDLSNNVAASEAIYNQMMLSFRFIR